ncbi:response regulator transcription factor [Clostridium taeniosporum]|uniref:Stage 0 sporulation protein A homolog n=1 Tax=Clostridium taeniosporum TaxID=394958 RepID=A0A1D7XKD9_9CLOT|nr:response regulator transcription factor [Clostridium taeniosporum]AOR23794.1 DNA-binding response regulator [Clostridium taeniosporum]
MDIKILIAEDDVVFRELICDIVRKEGYTPIEACDGKEAIDIFFGLNDIDLLILDIMMPIYDGIEVLKEIREKSDVPVIILTALDDEKNEVFGLEKGADDYIAKPFSYKVFTARLNKIVRKLNKEKVNEIVTGNIRINQEKHKVIANNLQVKLNNKEYSLLTYFIKNSERILSRDQILNKVWGYDFCGDIRTVDTHIKTLRAKLLECGKYIKTVRGSGYMFEGKDHENN